MKPADILTLIRSRMDALEMSTGDYLSAAFGDPKHDALKSLARGRSPSFERLQELLEPLGYEVTVGPSRSPTATGLAEAAREFLHIDGDRSALEQGYLPIPYHHADRAHRGATPLALAAAWLDDQGIDVERLYAIAAPSAEMAPVIASGETLLVDTSRRPGATVGLFACTVSGALRVGYAVEPTKGHVTLWFAGGETPAIVQFPRGGTPIFVQGQVVARFGSMMGVS